MRLFLLIVMLAVWVPASADLLLLLSGAADWTPGANVIIYDDFEYTVNRNDNDKSTFVGEGDGQQSWTQVKSEPYQSAKGYVYTVDSIDQFAGSFPGFNSSRVLMLESSEDTEDFQTDFFLQLDDLGGVVFPAEVWVQHWMYIVRTATYDSNLYESKWFYPCRGGHGSCGDLGYLTALARFWCDGASDGGGSEENFYMLMNTFTDAEDSTTDCVSDPNDTFYETNDAGVIPVNTWVLVKMHIKMTDDTGGDTINEFEVWRRTQGSQSWTQTADFIDGARTYALNIDTDKALGYDFFRWPTTSGHSVECTPTTCYDWWIAIDDFVIASTEAALPTYDD